MLTRSAATSYEIAWDELDESIDYPRYDDDGDILFLTGGELVVVNYPTSRPDPDRDLETENEIVKLSRIEERLASRGGYNPLVLSIREQIQTLLSK